MAQNKLSDLRNHLFETLEMVKNNNDPDASENEKISLENAKTIVSISAEIIETYKVEVQAMHVLSKAENIDRLIGAFSSSGLINDTKAISKP